MVRDAANPREYRFAVRAALEGPGGERGAAVEQAWHMR